jgi:hypothetical protein
VPTAVSQFASRDVNAASARRTPQMRIVMRASGSRNRSRLDPITDQVRPVNGQNASKLPGVILFAAIIGIAPLTFLLDRLMSGNWLISATAAVAIAGVLAVNAFLLVR